MLFWMVSGLYSASGLFAQNIRTNTAKTGNEERILTNDILYFADSSTRMGFAEVRALPAGRWGAYQAKDVFLEPGFAHWAKISFKVEAAPYKSVLFLGRSLETKAYICPGDSACSELFLDELRPSLFSKADIAMPGESGDFVVYIRNFNPIYTPPQHYASIQSIEKFESELNLSKQLQGALLGMLFLMFVYNIFLYWGIRGKVYLYYSLYALMMLGSFLEFEWASLHLISYHAEKIANFATLEFAFIFYFQFSRHFTNSFQFSARLDRTVKSWVWVGVVVTAAASFISLLVDDEAFLSQVAVLTFFAKIILILLLFAGALLEFLRSRKNIYIFFLTGTLCLGLGALFNVVSETLAWFPTLHFYIGSFEMGIIGELLLFSFGLSYKAKIDEQNKSEAQQKLVEQLRQNEALTEKVNRELEQKVRERTEEIEVQKQEIEAQHDSIKEKGAKLQNAFNHITDSVKYAQKIQNAILGSQSQIRDYFTDGFVLFMPKDIVSGDFYWFAQINGIKIALAADCTGHGVPGAFMTVLGTSLLREIVYEKKVTEPADILRELDKGIVKSLQKTAEASLNDGMDIAVLVFENDGRVLFAGAKSPLYKVRDGHLSEFKASKFPVGSQQFKTEKSYHTEQIEALPGDTFYLCSDGFQDQFGGMEDVKFMRKNFKALLAEISGICPMEGQKTYLKEKTENWRQSTPQTDDILVVGIMY